MRTNYGFILSTITDEETGEEKLVPFFPIVDSSDIINTQPVQLDEKLTQMSERWTLTDAVDGVDKTSYWFKSVYSNLTSDESGEPIGSSYLEAEVLYEAYRNGQLRVSGVARLDGTKASVDEQRDLYLKTLYLPFALPDTGMVTLSYPYGPVADLSMVASLDAVTIDNKNLNPKGSVKKYYGCLNIKEVVENTPGILDLFYRSADTSYATYTYESYIAKYLPIKFEISGLSWK